MMIINVIDITDLINNFAWFRLFRIDYMQLCIINNNNDNLYGTITQPYRYKGASETTTRKQPQEALFALQFGLPVLEMVMYCSITRIMFIVSYAILT